MSFVYVIAREGDHRVKIGSSIYPPGRLSSLQTGSPDRLSIAYTHRVAGSAEAVEYRAHAILDRHRGLGEWFSVPVDIAVAAISAAAYQVGEVAHDGVIPCAAPSWFRRSGVIAAAFTPACLGLAMHQQILALPAILIGGVVLLLTIRRAPPMSAGLWCVTGLSGIIEAVTIASLVSALWF